MRKKKKEITPVPVETDFYTEALKAFDVVLPPSEEELEAQRQAEEEKARKRTRRVRAAILAVVAVTVALVLWRPWNTHPPVTDGGVVNWPLPSETKIGFHVYTVPDYWAVSYTPYTGSWEFSRYQVEALLERLEALQWHSTLLMSSIPPSPIGDITITREGKTHTVQFSANGILFAEGYMAKPDAALWNDLFTLLQKMTAATNMGSFSTELVDGSVLYLDIQGDGSFVAMGDRGFIYSGYWGRVSEHLLLYTSDPRVGFATFRVGNDGGLTYLENHNFWLLQELKGCGPLYPVADTAEPAANLAVRLSMPGSETGKTGTVLLNRKQRDQFLALLDNAQWTPAIITGSMPQMCGTMLLFLSVGELSGDGRSIQFSSDGILQDGNLFAKLDDEDWMAFVELLALAGKQELAYRAYTPILEEGRILLQFTMDGRFEYRDDRDGDSVVVMGNYLQLGDVVLLAGPDGLREILLRDRNSGDLTTYSGEVLHQIPILYG